MRALTSSLRRAADTRWTLQPSEVDLFVKRALVLHQGEARDAISGEEMAVCAPPPLRSAASVSALGPARKCFLDPSSFGPKQFGSCDCENDQNLKSTGLTRNLGEL